MFKTSQESALFRFVKKGLKAYFAVSAYSDEGLSIMA